MESIRANSQLDVADMARHDIWCTAAVVDRAVAKKFIRRLNASGIDHTAIHEGRLVRISVRQIELDAAKRLTPEPETRLSKQESHNRRQKMLRRMLVSIHVGAFVGTFIGYQLDAPSPQLSALSALVVTAVVEAFAHRRALSALKPTSEAETAG